MADLTPHGITTELITPVSWGGIDQNIVFHLFKDGRVTGLMIEHWFDHHFRNITRSGDEATPFDLYLRHNKKTLHYQSKVTNGKPFDLAPSYMKGKGRKYDELGMREAMASIDGYVLTDLSDFPRLTIWTIPTWALRQQITAKSCKVKLQQAADLARLKPAHAEQTSLLTLQ